MILYEEKLFGKEYFRVRLECNKLYLIDSKISSKEFEISKPNFIKDYSCIFEPECFLEILKAVNDNQ